MADASRPGRAAKAPAHEYATKPTTPALAALPFRLVRGAVGLPGRGRDYLEYEVVTTVAAGGPSKGGTLKRAPLTPGHPQESLPTLSATPLTVRQPCRLLDYQPGFGPVCELIGMYRALEHKSNDQAREIDELKSRLAALERR